MSSRSKPDDTVSDLKATLVENAVRSIADDVAAEHILLAGDDVEHESAHDARSGRGVRQRLVLNNRLRGLRTELVTYEGGYLDVRVERRGKPRQTVTLNLRFVDSRPVLSRAVPSVWLKMGLWSIACGALFWALARWSVLPDVMGPAAALSVAGGVLAWIVAARRASEQAVFRTLHGQIPVLRLAANLGCLRAGRALVPRVVAAIREAHALTERDQRQRLRQEMREHYRLREVGAITPDACATGTRRILSRFE